MDYFVLLTLFTGACQIFLRRKWINSLNEKLEKFCRQVTENYLFF